MIKPIRVQRKRTKGFKLPENTICVTRGTRWGNPFKIGQFCIHDNEGAVEMYKAWINVQRRSGPPYNAGIPPTFEEIKKELAGKNLACFCKLDDYCHADVLLKIANDL